jgi:DNA-binding NarL/FixJ family response regulator
MLKKNARKTQRKVMIATLDAALSRKFTLALRNIFTVHIASERAALENTIAQSKPTILLLDSQLIHMNNKTDIVAIQGLSPSTKIIVMSGSKNDEEEALNVIKSGAKGYFNKEIDISLLRKGINVIQKGELWASRKTISRLLSELTSLTEIREKQLGSFSVPVINPQLGKYIIGKTGGGSSVIRNLGRKKII